MANPNRGMWGPGGQPGGGHNHLQASTGGRANSTHEQAFNYLTDVAHRVLTRTAPGSVIPVNVNVPRGPANFAQLYTIWYILDRVVADELRRIFAFAPLRLFPLSLCLLLTCLYRLTSAASPTSSSVRVTNPRTTLSGVLASTSTP
jgi:hypothetical protein